MVSRDEAKKKKKIAKQNSKLPILNIFFQKFYELVLGLVGIIDAKGFVVAQPIWSLGFQTQSKEERHLK